MTLPFIPKRLAQFQERGGFLENANNPHFHGHNYELVVKVTGDIDKETGYVIDVKILKDIIKSEVEDSFDHKNLNLEVEEFKNLNPTAENISVVIYNKIKPKLKPDLELEVELYETREILFLTKENDKYLNKIELASVKNLKKDINYVLGDIIEAVYIWK